MIESIEFKNFKALRDTTLPLGPCTIIVGPNGSGKSTVLQALEAVREPKNVTYERITSFRIRNTEIATTSIRLHWNDLPPSVALEISWNSNHPVAIGIVAPDETNRQTGRAGQSFIKAHLDEKYGKSIQNTVGKIRVFSLDANRIAQPSPVQGIIELAGDGAGLATVLDGMRDDAPEQFKAIESQIGGWLPEFDRILFDRPKQGEKSVALRTREGGHKVPASDLSQGTLIALALLTLAYHPTPPSLIALEEPDRGIHPHLLRHIKDTLCRLSHPESCGEKREPVQVIATTHSPYFLDLFRETPEDVVVANKIGANVTFERLTDQPHFQDILGEAALGDAWFSGVLGGVPIPS
jgi:predicted ATPase